MYNLLLLLLYLIIGVYKSATYVTIDTVSDVNNQHVISFDRRTDGRI